MVEWAVWPVVMVRADTLVDTLAEWPAVWLVELELELAKADMLADTLVEWLADMLADTLVEWLADTLVDTLAEWPADMVRADTLVEWPVDMVRADTLAAVWLVELELELVKVDTPVDMVRADTLAVDMAKVVTVKADTPVDMAKVVTVRADTQVDTAKADGDQVQVNGVVKVTTGLQAKLLTTIKCSKVRAYHTRWVWPAAVADTMVTAAATVLLDLTQ
jgi:hypothetical protein